jgi:hypothetical protein
MKSLLGCDFAYFLLIGTNVVRTCWLFPQDRKFVTTLKIKEFVASIFRVEGRIDYLED